MNHSGIFRIIKVFFENSLIGDDFRALKAGHVAKWTDPRRKGAKFAA